LYRRAFQLLTSQTVTKHITVVTPPGGHPNAVR